MSYPNYLIYAAMIMTAHKVGVDAKYVSLAESVFKDKFMPEPVLLGVLGKATEEAQQLVLNAGLGSKADALAQQLLTTGKF